MVVATEGEATTTRKFDVGLWKASPDHPDRNPEELLTAFIDELVATIDTIGPSGQRS